MNNHAIGCVADNSDKYLAQALRLLKSWRWFAGVFVETPFHVCVVESVPDEYRKYYESLGAYVHIVDRFSDAHLPSNKLRFLELPQLADAERVVLLDCDIIIAQEPADLFGDADFIAKIADFQTVTPEVFETLFAAFGIRMPDATETCTVRGEQTIPYFNAGVLSFSHKAMVTLVPEWIRLNQELAGRLDLLEDCKNFCEQASLSLALAKSGTVYKTLTNRSNFPAHCHDQPLDSEFAATDPMLIHYHWLVDDQGFLMPSPYPNVNKRIDAFNVRLHGDAVEEQTKGFDNRSFWNSRYIKDPALGSGIGSRGYLAIYKKAILRSVVANFAPISTLDVGCGDMAVSAILPSHGYTGVDVSPALINANSSAYPKRHFLCGDFLSLAMEKHALVVCLDVLIHIQKRFDYLSFVEKLVRMTDEVGVVAAYEESPTISSEITFFHEPVTLSLRKAGAVEIRQIGAYNQVRVFQFATRNSSKNALARLEKPVFLVGAMRSGTTLLADMLGTSPYVAHCPFELKDVWSSVGGVPMASPKTRDHDCPECRAEFGSTDMQARLIDAFKERIGGLSGKSAGAVFLNKNPHLCNKLELVIKLFPDARIIWIYRHLPQVVASIKILFADVYNRQQTRHYWPLPAPHVHNRCWNAVHNEELMEDVSLDRVFPGGDVYHLAEYWFESNRAVAEFYSGEHRKQCIAVDEETLLTSPMDVLANIYGSLQLPFQQVKVAGLDKERNEIWKNILDEKDLLSLLRFVKDRGSEINTLFFGGDCVQFYLDQLTHAIDGKSSDQ